MASSMKILLVFIICVLIIGGTTAKTLTMEEKKHILKTHNDIRQGKNLPKLKWDESLAKKAQTWADTCNYWHHNKKLGENIAYDDDNGPQNVQEAITSSMKMWMLEKTFDVHGDFSCCGDRRKDCCHYTQVLWKDTKTIGCGFSRCENMDGSIFTVCYYYPRGNVPGRKPY